MREELKNPDWHVYGLSEKDFDYTINIVERLMKSSVVLTNQKTENVSDDASDDLVYYAWIETQYLWHFCLWRLQAVFEGMITKRFLRLDTADRLVGLKAKLDAMRSAGFSIPQEVYDELLLWANLRNALSHSPPEQFRPVEIRRGDIEEYLGLLKPLIANWRDKQRSK